MTFEEFKIKLKGILINQMGGKPQYTGWVGIKCKFCGDSASSNPHLFISCIPEKPVILHCFQPECEVSRPMSAKDLLIIGIVDKEMLETLNYYRATNTIMIQDYARREGLKFPEPNEFVLQYVKQRTNLSTHFLNEYKVVMDLPKFIEVNDFENKKEIQKSFIKHGITSDNGVAFLNENNTRMNVRNLSIKDYYQIPLIRQTNDGLFRHTPYVHKIISDKKEKMTLVLSETNFDRINTVKIMKERFPDVANMIFITSSSVSGMRAVFKQMTKKHPYMDIIIFSHSDISLSYYKYKLLYHYDYRVNTFRVLYNVVSKDFGDLSLPIEIKEERLK